MTMAVALIGAVLVLWAAIVLYCVVRRGLTFHQAALYAPFKLALRIDDGMIGEARNAAPPVIYAVWHRSRVDPALMLALLPSDTLHILDEESANAWWLDPWRALARSIVFNARHVFVSRRLVQRLKGGGRLAVYLPDDEAPDPKTFRLFRAIARIAAKADARVVPIDLEGAQHAAFSLAPDGGRKILPRIRIATLAPLTLTEMAELSQAESPKLSSLLLDRMIAVRRRAGGEKTPPLDDAA